MKIKYQKATFSRIRPSEIKAVVSEMKQIQRDYSVVNPISVVERAKSPKSALHRYFDWNDSSAGAKYRLWQARQLIAQVHIVDSDDPNCEPVRAFVHVKPDIDDEDFVYGPGYVATETINKKPNFQNQVLLYAEQQLMQWRKRYGSYAKFWKVAEEIDKLNLKL